MEAFRTRLFRGGIYPILDADFLKSHGRDLLSEAGRFLEARPPILQLRAKSMTVTEYRKLLMQLIPFVQEADTLLFANDHAECAAAAGCAGVHVGQGDLGVFELRERFPELLVGLSTHNSIQFREGLELRPDYIALGPIFQTSSKKNADPAVGLALLASLAPLAAKAGIPLVTIGGIDEKHFSALAPHSNWLAMISSLYAQLVDTISQDSPSQEFDLITHYKKLDSSYLDSRLKDKA